MQDSFFEIRSFPLTKQRGRRYPVSYTTGGVLTAITIPIGTLECSPDCYAHSDHPELNDSINTQVCVVCKKKQFEITYFIDIGLMMFIQKNRTLINSNKYAFACMDNEGRLITWQPFGSPLMDALAKYSARRIIEKCIKDINVINYIKMKNIIRQRFSAICDDFKKSKKNKVLTWCRANLKIDEQFDGIIINTSAKPNEFSYCKFIDEVGSGVTFEGKQTHINYISSENIFIIIVVTNNVRKAVDTYVADLTQAMMDNNKLIIMQANLNLTTFRNWFSTSYDNQDNVLYVHGGEYSSKNNTGRIQKFSQIKWNGRALEYNFQNFFDLPVARSLSACTTVWLEKSKALLVGGGISIKDRTTRYQLQCNMFAYKRQEEHVSQKGMAGSFKNKIGAYSNMIEVPRIPGKEKPGVLIFGGNSDFRTDVDRQEFCKVYLWKNKEHLVQLPQKCSNNNYPFLFESTGIILKTANNQYVIRALIPARSSASKATKAYLLQYNITTSTLKETAINGTHIK